jgi:prepilin-type N-terminal cleavage/methylation domain-containing protein
MTSESKICPHPRVAVEPRRFGRRCAFKMLAQCPGLRARGMTLFEVLVVVALIGAVMAITLPLIVSQTRRLTWGEVIAQIERHAAVVRSDAQRESEAIWFEARWIEKDNAWALGVAQMMRDQESEFSSDDELAAALLGDMETALGDESMDQPPMFADEPDSMTGFEVRLRLPRGYRIERSLPEEVAALSDQGSLLNEEDFGLEPEELLDSALDEGDGGFAEDEAAHEPGGRVLLAVFLPDGTLIGPQRVYLFEPGGRIATISMSPWLGSVHCETLTLGTLAGLEDDDKSLDDESASDEPTDAESPGSDVPESPGTGAPVDGPNPAGGGS